MYRVLWLRAHARKTRWEEEVEIVGEEMHRMGTSLQDRKDQWLRRTNSSLGRGYQAWAYRQAALWGTLDTHATREFSEAQRIWKAPVMSL